MAVLLPDALDRTSHAPQVVVRTAEMHGACLGGLVFEHAAAMCGGGSIRRSTWTLLTQPVLLCTTQTLASSDCHVTLNLRAT